MPGAMDTIAAEANRLYWETDTSVADIAMQLELSRRALYSVVDPLPTSNSCEVCGSPLVFENRSARASGIEMCPNCDTADVPAARSASGDVAAAGASSPDTADAADAIEAAIAEAWNGLSPEGQRAVIVGGAAAAGLALGALLTLVLVPRR